MHYRIILVSFCLLIFFGCRNKSEETAGNPPSSSQPQLTQGEPADSDHTAHGDSVDAKGKPLPPVPVEDMTREQIASYKKLLAEKGFYSCCIEPNCRMCLFELEECPCEHNVKKKEAVCGECYDGWQAGKGNVRGVKQKDVKKM
ncbi:MAG TPA: hypothetical protein VII11_04965 [Bacteroidota bacterium]